MGPLAENLGACQRQLVELAELQRTMKEKQPAIQRLSTFVAVVDSGQTTVVKEQQQKSGAGAETAEGAVTEEAAFVQLETLVKQVSCIMSFFFNKKKERIPYCLVIRHRHYIILNFFLSIFSFFA